MSDVSRERENYVFRNFSLKIRRHVTWHRIEMTKKILRLFCVRFFSLVYNHHSDTLCNFVLNAWCTFCELVIKVKIFHNLTWTIYEWALGVQTLLTQKPFKTITILSCLTFQTLNCSFDEIIIMISMTTSAKMMKTRRQMMNLKTCLQMMTQATQQSVRMTSPRTPVRLIKRRLIQKTMPTTENIQFSKNASLSRRKSQEMIQKFLFHSRVCPNRLQV